MEGARESGFVAGTAKGFGAAGAVLGTPMVGAAEGNAAVLASGWAWLVSAGFAQENPEDPENAESPVVPVVELNPAKGLAAAPDTPPVVEEAPSVEKGD